jgi:hypothetical protein
VLTLLPFFSHLFLPATFILKSSLYTSAECELCYIIFFKQFMSSCLAKVQCSISYVCIPQVLDSMVFLYQQYIYTCVIKFTACPAHNIILSQTVDIKIVFGPISSTPVFSSILHFSDMLHTPYHIHWIWSILLHFDDPDSLQLSSWIIFLNNLSSFLAFSFSLYRFIVRFVLYYGL